MRCKKIEKLLSDSLDGKLPEKKKEILEEHIERCVSCRSYAKVIKRIHKETESLEMPEVTPSYWEEFSSRLKTKVSLFHPEEKQGKLLFLRWKWVWTGAALIFILAVVSFLYFTQNKAPQEVYVFSFENSFAKIYQEIGNDPELEELFNSLVLASIGEALGDSEGFMPPEFYESTFFLEDLTEEEMEFLESEIKKDSKS